MNLEGIMLSEVNQTQKDKYCMISHMWNLKKVNLQNQRVEMWFPGAKGWGK